MTKKIVTSETMPTEGVFTALFRTSDGVASVNLKWENGGLLTVPQYKCVTASKEFLATADVFVTSIEGD